MTQNDMNQNIESVLFCNKEQSVILLDIPRSVAEAQCLSRASAKHASALPTNDASKSKLEPGHESVDKSQIRWSIISAPPLEEPYPASIEPKTEASRRRVLSRIPQSEQEYHDEYIRPLVTEALKEIQNSYSPEARWCLPRVTRDKGEQEDQAEHEYTSKKRNADHFQSHPIRTPEEDAEVMARFPDGLPTILSSDSTNKFSSLAELSGSLAKNLSSKPIALSIKSTEQGQNDGCSSPSEYIVPPRSHFIHGELPLSECDLSGPSYVPGLPHEPRFNLILFDPPWPNRSVKRSRGYQTHAYNEMEDLSEWIRDVLGTHGYNSFFPVPKMPSTTTTPHMDPRPLSQDVFGAIWITNSEKARNVAYQALQQAGYHVFEEWIWVKVTANGQPVYPVDGIWRKPYEILVIGQQGEREEIEKTEPENLEVSVAQERHPWDVQETSCYADFTNVFHDKIRRRVIAAVPDLHSRKPNLKSLFERILFSSESGESEPQSMQYSAMEVFARNLTAEWSACGNEVLKFNSRDCWVENDESI